MNTAVVVDNQRSWFMPFARRLVDRLARHGPSELLSDAALIRNGTDIAFLLSSEKIVPADVLTRSAHTIVVHASALPRGRGMSPMTWQILEGASLVPVSLFEAVEKLDAGPIYLSDTVEFEGTELLPQLQARLGAKVVEMCLRFASDPEGLAQRAVPQSGAPTHYRRRTPSDSRLDPHRTIAQQFDLLRVVDNRRYPAFFDHRGRRYILTIRRGDDPE